MPMSIKTPSDYSQVYSAILFDDEMSPEEVTYVTKLCPGEYLRVLTVDLLQTPHRPTVLQDVPSLLHAH